jgi:hypothetical protein
MKSLTKLVIMVIVLAMATVSYAQTIGLKAGLNLSTMLIKDDNASYDDSFRMNPGFHIGATAEFPIIDVLSIETGFIFSTKGFAYSEEILMVLIEGKMDLLYLDIPLNAKITVGAGNAKIYGLMGPYVGIGLAGTSEGTISSLGITIDDDSVIEWGPDGDLRRFDLGFNAGVGVIVNSVQFGLSYAIGLANISTNANNGYHANNRVLSMSAAYMFGDK